MPQYKIICSPLSLPFHHNEQTNEDLHLDFDNMDFHRTNPATGLPMSGIGASAKVEINQEVLKTVNNH